MTPLREAKRDFVRGHIMRALSEAGGSMRKAAAMLGVHRTEMYRLLERYGIHVEHRAYGRKSAKA